MYIFDLDGTITDSNSLWLDVDHAFLSKRNLTATQQYRDEISLSIFPVAARLTKDYFSLEESTDAIMEEWEALAEYYYGNTVELKEGAAELLEKCAAKDIPLALFSAGRPYLARLVLDRYDLTRYFRHLVFAEDIGLVKHDPRCFLEMSRLIGVPPEQCTFFDDNPSNCATALSVGMSAVGVYDEFYADRQEELRKFSTQYVRSLKDFTI